MHTGSRLYDPRTGRFLQPDPFVQMPENGQNLNRYSYVLNNPLSYNDPSGHFVAALTTTILAQYGVLQTGQLAFAAMVMSGTEAYIRTGSSGSAIAAMGSSVATTAIGDAFHQSATKGGVKEGAKESADKLGATQRVFAKATIHGVVQGASQAGLGGEFEDGFAGGFVGSLAELGPDSGIGGLTVTAVLGGTASKITGGKFANGAMSAAFVYAFNQAAHNDEPNLGDVLTGLAANSRIQKLLRYVESLSASQFASEFPDIAAKAPGEPLIAQSALIQDLRLMTLDSALVIIRDSLEVGTDSLDQLVGLSRFNAVKQAGKLMGVSKEAVLLADKINIAKEVASKSYSVGDAVGKIYRDEVLIEHINRQQQKILYNR